MIISRKKYEELKKENADLKKVAGVRDVTCVKLRAQLFDAENTAKQAKSLNEINAGAAAMANDCLVDVARALAQCKTINSKALKVAIARLEEYYCCPIENIGGKKDE